MKICITSYMQLSTSKKETGKLDMCFGGFISLELLPSLPH